MKCSCPCIVTEVSATAAPCFGEADPVRVSDLLIQVHGAVSDITSFRFQVCMEMFLETVRALIQALTVATFLNLVLQACACGLCLQVGTDDKPQS